MSNRVVLVEDDDLFKGDFKGKCVAVVSFFRPGQEVARLVRGQGAREVRVIDCTGSGVDSEDVASAQPGDLTRIGVRLSGFLEEFPPDCKETLVVIDSLNALLMYSSLKTVYRFLHTLVGRLRSQGTGGRFLISRRGMNAQEYHTLLTLFDQIEVAGGQLVMVVEDDREVADLYEEILKPCFKVIKVYSGEEALAKLTPDVDLVLLDRMMPGMNGDTLLREIRSRPKLVDIPVVMLTALKPGIDDLELEFQDYLVKPVQPSDLVSTVRRVMAVHRYNRELEALVSRVNKKVMLLQQARREELQRSPVFQELEREITESQTRLESLLQHLFETGGEFGDNLKLLLKGGKRK